MFELSEIEELANQVNLSILYEIAKNSAQIGNEILKVNYNKIQKISSKGRKGDLVTNVDLEVENKIKEYLLEETPNISINACLLYTSPSPRDTIRSRMPSSA